MMWRMFVSGAASRTAFPGVAALYRALHRGASGEERNPMLYVSRGPWSMYEILEAFFRRHQIPDGPVLFLRDWGLTLQQPRLDRGASHKEEHIRTMLEVLQDLPAVLIGDSGQHDPETYAAALREHPNRVIAVLLREIDPANAERRREVVALGAEFEAMGVPWILAPDSFALAEAAARIGLISKEDLTSVLVERDVERNAEGESGLPN